MKIHSIILFLLLTPTLFAQKLLVEPQDLEKNLPNAKAALKWGNSEFDPLRIEFSQKIGRQGLRTEDQAHINAIKNSIQEHGIDGVVFGRGSMDSKVLIDDHIFSEADEIGFVDAEGEWMPIYHGRSVILLEVQREKGVFLVSGKDSDAIDRENGAKFDLVWPDFFKF